MRISSTIGFVFDGRSIARRTRALFLISVDNGLRWRRDRSLVKHWSSVLCSSQFFEVRQAGLSEASASKRHAGTSTVHGARRAEGAI